MVREHWEDAADPDEAKTLFTILEADRALVRESIVDAIIQAPPAIRSQFSQALSTIVSADYPIKWPTLNDRLIAYIGGDRPELWMGAFIVLLRVVKHFEYRILHSSTPLTSSRHVHFLVQLDSILFWHMIDLLLLGGCCLSLEFLSQISFIYKIIDFHSSSLYAVDEEIKLQLLRRGRRFPS